MKRRTFRSNCSCGDPCCEEVDCCDQPVIGFERSTQMAHQAIDLVGGLVGLITNPAVAGRSVSRHHGKHFSCGCGNEFKTRHHLHATTDIKLETQIGEQRVISFLVENNRPKEATLTFKVGPWLDAEGHAAAIPVEFTPATATLKPGESVGVRALVKVAEPVEAGMVYYTEFILEGCSVRPVTIGMLVQSGSCYAHYVLCDECRRPRGRFVEYCDDCGCERTGGCGGCRHCDPHHHWFDTCSCAWYYRAS